MPEKEEGENETNAMQKVNECNWEPDPKKSKRRKRNRNQKKTMTKNVQNCLIQCTRVCPALGDANFTIRPIKKFLFSLVAFDLLSRTTSDLGSLRNIFL